MTFDRYGSDALADFRRSRVPFVAPSLAVEPGLVIEVSATGFVGAVVRYAHGLVELEDRLGGVRTFPLGAGYLVEGHPVTLTKPSNDPREKARRTASGSLAVEDARARVALPSRIFVEGRHDAELVEKVWGDDLRAEGVVVEYLEGVDNLEAVLAAFRPGPGRRVGVLVNHLVAGSKESKVAEAVNRGPFGAHVLVVGHPFVDIWQAVKPDRLGMPSWPVIERGVEWKYGVCQALGWPRDSQADIAQAWRRILSRVTSFADLEPALLARVEQLIDFVTEPADTVY